jgi:MFS family permease
MIIRSDDDLFANSNSSELDAKNHPKKMQVEMKSKNPAAAAVPTSSLLKSHVAAHHEKDVMYKPVPVSVKESSMYEQLTSPTYIWITIFFLINSFWANFYIGVIDLQLGDSQLYTSEEQKEFGRLFTAIMTCGFIAIPIVGAVMDKYGFPMTSLFTTFFGVVWSICLLSKSRSAAIPSFVSYALFRTFLFTFLFAYLADVFGFKYFGILGGIMFVLGGLLSLIQYSLTAWAAGTCHSFETVEPGCSSGNWDVINMVQLLSQFVLLAFTYQDWIRRRREAAIFTRVRSRNKLSEAGYGAVATADNA